MKNILSYPISLPPKKCQWIEGDPSPDDSCKCHAETIPGKPYCAEHSRRAYRHDAQAMI